jgi:plastocyanin
MATQIRWTTLCTGICLGLSAVADTTQAAGRPVVHAFGRGPTVVHPRPGFIRPGPNFIHPRPNFIHPGPGFIRPGPNFIRPGPNFIHPGPTFVRPGPTFAVRGHEFRHGPGFFHHHHHHHHHRGFLGRVHEFRHWEHYFARLNALAASQALSGAVPTPESPASAYPILDGAANPYLTPYDPLGSPSAAAAPAQVNPVVNVGLYDDAIQPRSITVSPGTTVQWTNHGARPHTVTSDTGLWDSRLLDSGQTDSATFSAPGTYRYHCTRHPEKMRGVIVVE